ncbi:hypothetical protein RRG08_047300 [Elysia crispata]|uniref:Uncharacterized protein n=1 Tax=Elysia crispata TaxID=231223 RepID=A0AAE0YYJ3_9GAST|nr:hypothetical protein RRG08_047300 [Elysia crispata]
MSSEVWSFVISLPRDVQITLIGDGVEERSSRCRAHVIETSTSLTNSTFSVLPVAHPAKDYSHAMQTFPL